MNKFEVNELLDFYSSLLTDKQREICHEYFNEDLSYQEIAEEMNISRTAVYDTVKTVKQELQKYEEKLGLLSSYKKRSSLYEKIRECTDDTSILSYIDDLEKNENGGYYE